MFIALSITLFNQNIFASEKIKIGLIVPLSGENSLIGEKIIKSIRMAINKINDERVEIIPKDTKSNPIDALKPFSITSISLVFVISNKFE